MVLMAKDPVKVIQVDNIRGNDSLGDGSREKPYATIMRGVGELHPGFLLNVANTGTPYHESVRISESGTAEDPIILEGNGAVNSGMMRRPSSDWKAEGGGVFSIPLKNNAWGMQHYWEGGFELARFAGKPGRNVTARDALQPFDYFLYKNQKELKTDVLHNTLFIRLPEGKTPDDIEVQVVSLVSPFACPASHVTIRHFVAEYAGDDGFSSVKPGQGILFEDVEARFNMDQGVSNHGSGVTVRRAYLHQNAGCGIVDVYPEARVRYEECLVEEDTWRGGVEFNNGKYEMENCVIRKNPRSALIVTKGAEVKLRNCLLTSPETNPASGIKVTGGGKLTMENCTVAGFKTGLMVDETSRIAMTNTAFLNCGVNLEVRTASETEAPFSDFSTMLVSDGLAFGPGLFLLLEKTVVNGSPKTGQRSLNGVEWLALRRQGGLDGNSLALPAKISLSEPPLTLPELDGKGFTQGSGKTDIGSRFLKLPGVDCGKITK